MHTSCPRSLSNAIKDLTIPPNDLFPAKHNLQSSLRMHISSSVYVCPEIKSRKCTSDKKSQTGSQCLWKWTLEQQVSLISQTTQCTLFPDATLVKPGVQLRTYTQEPIAVVGKMEVEVRHKGYVGWHELFVIKGSGPSLIGRDWLSKIRLGWASIKAIATSKMNPEVESLLQSYSQVFESGPGLMKQIKASLTLKPEARPRFCHPRSVPYAI